MLTSHICDPRSIPILAVSCGLSLLLVLTLVSGLTQLSPLISSKPVFKLILFESAAQCRNKRNLENAHTINKSNYLCICKKIHPSLESVVKLWESPRCNDLQKGKKLVNCYNSTKLSQTHINSHICTRGKKVTDLGVN